MLIVARHMGDEITVGENIVIKVIRVGDKIVRLGIDAPKDLLIQSKKAADCTEFDKRSINC